MPKSIAIVGVGFTPMERKPDRSFARLALDAALEAIRDAGLKAGDIDGYAGAPPSPNANATHADGFDEVSAGYIIGALGLKSVFWWAESNRGLVSDALIEAIHAIQAGACRSVLIVRAMYNPIDKRYAEQGFARVAGPSQFTAPYGGNSGISRAAFWLQRYMHDHGASRADLFQVAKTLRDHALLNPYAYWHGKPPLGESEYLGARFIYEPMGLYDCDIPVTGAGALVLTTGDRAAHLREKPAYIRGFATRDEGYETVYRKSGTTAAEMQVAQLYDGFLPFVWGWLERLEFCGKGEAYQFTRDGNIALGGSLPVTTFGGSIGEGRLHGMGHLREGALQVMGRAGARQVPNTRNCVVSFGSDWVPGAAVVLSTEPGRG